MSPSEDARKMMECRSVDWMMGIKWNVEEAEYFEICVQLLLYVTAGTVQGFLIMEPSIYEENVVWPLQAVQQLNKRVILKDWKMSIYAKADSVISCALRTT